MTSKDIPLISQLLKCIILEDYKKALDIVNDDKFDPNEINSSWSAPVLTALITLASSSNSKNEDGLKNVIKAIINHEKFNPNIKDDFGETALMHIARHPEFNWVAPFILNIKSLDLSIRNFMHRTALEIAERENNSMLADILLGVSIENIVKGQPKKHIGLKKIAKITSITVSSNKNSTKNIIDRIESAFNEDVKKIPTSLYNLLKTFFYHDYDTCIQIAKDVNFNPNECDRWDEPALSSLIYYSQDSNVEYDEEAFKKIASAIISNHKFDVNALDADCNTILMVAMGFPKLNWLVEMLFNIQSARLDVVNDCGESIRQIAENCGNGEFYNHLIQKSFEMAEIVN